MPKVSVIIPVYGAEKYIERCARSLFEQTLGDIEYIFVDDCSPDSSIDILLRVLEEYPYRRNQVKILYHEHNKGVASARTTGMKAAAGEYMIHCDPDDWVAPEMYMDMYLTAKNESANIVTCRLCMHKRHSTVYGGNLFEGKGIDCLRRMDFEPSLCTKLIDSTIINHYLIYPYKGINCGEDLNVIFRCLYFADKVTFVDKVLYHYDCQDINSITRSSIEKNIDLYLISNFKKLETFAYQCNNSTVLKTISYLKFSAKAPLLWAKYDVAFRDVKYWCKLWKECHKDLKTHPQFSKKQRMLFPMIADYPILMYFYAIHLKKL